MEDEFEVCPLVEALELGVEFPAADISVVRHAQADAVLTVVMHFSRIVDGPDQDLEIVFDAPLAFQWEDEVYGVIELPQVLPKCPSPRWNSYTFPLLEVSGSRWADVYARRVFTETEHEIKHVLHFALISLNDLVHVLSIKRPILRWAKSVSGW